MADGYQDLTPFSFVSAYSLSLVSKAQGLLVLKGSNSTPSQEVVSSCCPIPWEMPAQCTEVPLSWPCPWVGCLLLGWPKYCVLGW